MPERGDCRLVTEGKESCHLAMPRCSGHAAVTVGAVRTARTPLNGPGLISPGLSDYHAVLGHRGPRATPLPRTCRPRLHDGARRTQTSRAQSACPWLQYMAASEMHARGGHADGLPTGWARASAVVRQHVAVPHALHDVHVHVIC